jgi:hypothetical protein
MEFLNKLYRNVYYLTKLRKLEQRNSLKNNINPKSTIGIFSSPRGGSTWLAEIMTKATAPSSLILEPLYRGVYQTNGAMPTEHKAGLPTNELGYWYYQHIGENEAWPESKEFFRKLLNREYLPLSITYENKYSDIPKSNSFIFKFCYAHLLMPWLMNNFNFSAVFLIRHPGAVISSQMNHVNWSHIRGKNEYRFLLPQFRNSDFFNPYRHILDNISTPEENLAALWAITNGYVINHPFNNVKWQTISYEELFLNPKEILQEVFEGLGIPFTDNILNEVKNPSKTSSSSFLQNKNHLSNWRKQFSSEQINRIGKVLSEFGIDFYSMEEDLPNSDIIKSLIKK